MSYVSEVLADSPLLYWRLNEASGVLAADTTGNGRTGAISATGVTYSVPGGVLGSTGLTFDGTAGRIKSTATMTPASSVVTLECWAKFPSFNNTDDLLAEYSPDWNSNNGSWINDACASAGNWLVGLRGPGGTSAFRGFTRPSTGVFHHFVFVFDAAATTRFVVYIDTVVQTLTGSGNSTSGNFGVYNLNIASRNATGLFLNATIDDVAYYNTELSAARVAAHYAAATASDFVPRAIII